MARCDIAGFGRPTAPAGRLPVVYVFNPFVEGHVALGRAFTPVRHQARLARDLANLPQFLCQQGDIVLVHERPSAAFLEGLRRAGFSMPEFVEPAAMTPQGVGDALRSRELGGLCPWGWGPDAIELFEPLVPQVVGDLQAPSERYNPALGALYSKAWSAAFLRRWLEELRGEAAGDDRSIPQAIVDLLCPPESAGTDASSPTEVIAAVAEIRARGHHRVVIKQAVGLAGNNSIRLWEPDWLKAQRAWVEGSFDKERKLVVEPWLERVLDFSLQLEMEEDGLKLRGFTGLINDPKGQFRGNWAAADHTSRPPPELCRCLPAAPGVDGGVVRLFEDLVERLEPELRAAGFAGPLGIDAFAYRDAGGSCRVKPLVEINPRYTMGRLTLELMRHVAPGRCGTLRILNTAALRDAGTTDFLAFARGLQERSPLRFEGEPIPRISEGTLCLNDPARAGAALATFQATPPGDQGLAMYPWCMPM